MAVDNAKIFKFQALKLLDYETYAELVNIEAAGSAVFGFAPELAEQMSGPSLYPIETEVSMISTEATLNIGEYGSKVLEALMNTKTTTISATSGNVTEVRDIKGDIVASGGSIITALSLNTDTTKIKSGLFRAVISDVASKQLKVYAISSPDLTPSEYEDSASSLVKTVTLTDGGTLDLGMGVNATAAATVSLATGNLNDAFLFRVVSPSSGAFTAEVGQVGQRIPKVKVLCLSRTMSDGRWLEMFGYNAIFPGLNLSFADDFSANEITGKLIFDPVVKKVADITARKV